MEYVIRNRRGRGDRDDHSIDAKTNPLKKIRGSALMTVLIVGMGLLTVVGVTLQWGVTEKKLNVRHILRHEAKNAAESVVEYGFAELIARFEGQSSFPINELHPDNSPLNLPSSATAFFTGSNISTASGDLVLTGSVIPPGEWMYIDPADPANEFDPLKGKRVFVRDVAVYGKATAVASGFGSNVTAYTMQRLQVRDAPLFGHAIFYNMDLEFHPGPAMDMYGPVHSNTDLFLHASSRLTFHEGLSAAGKVLHGRPWLTYNDDGSYAVDYGGSGDKTQDGDIFIKDVSGNDVNVHIGGDRSLVSSWLDNRNPDWRELSAQRFDGFVQDEAHGVPKLNPIAIDDYVPDDVSTTADETMNTGYAIIEPLLPSGHPDRKPDGLREQKFAMKAGLILKVEDHPLWDPDAPDYNYRYQVNAYQYSRVNPAVPVSDQNPATNIVFDANGDPVLLPVTLPEGLVGNANSSMTAIEEVDYSGTYDPVNMRGNPEMVQFDGSGDWDDASGMYDDRQDRYMDILSLDIGMLRELVDDNANPSGTDLAAKWGGTYDPTTSWNGVVYIESPVTSGASGRADNIKPAADANLGVQLINGEHIPSPTGTPSPGLTIATNAPLYTVGNYNADGNDHPNDANAYESGEPPAAIVAEAVTILSNNWPNKRQYSENSKNSRTTTYTEFSAAILTGLTTSPYNLTGSTGGSGGAHNFPNFLEKWSGSSSDGGNKQLTIRGSLVALFEREVHTVPMTCCPHYSPPQRDWGFNNNFREGTYPPGTPNSRTFRRTAFRDMTEAEYNTAISSIGWSVP